LRLRRQPLFYIQVQNAKNPDFPAKHAKNDYTLVLKSDMIKVYDLIFVDF